MKNLPGIENFIAGYNKNPNAECPLAKKLIDDIYFCKYKGKCVDKIELGQGKNHYFCAARLEGFKGLENRISHEGEGKK